MKRNRTVEEQSSQKRALRLVERLARAIVRKQHLRPVMQNLAEALVSEFGFRAVFLSEYHESRDNFTALGAAPLKTLQAVVSRTLGVKLQEFEFSSSPNRSRVIQALFKGRAWMGNDLSEILALTFSPRAVRRLQKELNVRCIYNAPLVSGNHFLGTLLVGTDSETFSKNELAVLRAITHHAALGAHQAYLLGENRSKARQYRVLSEVDSHILEEKQLQKVLHAIVSNIHWVTPCDLAGVFLHNQQKKTMTYAVAWPRTDFSLKLRHMEFPIGTGIIGSVARTRKGEIVNHAEHDPRSVYPARSIPDLEHLLCLPLIAGRSLLGVLYIARYHDEPFVEADLDVARRFGEKSALAIENAHLFARQQARQKEMEGLQESGTRISESLDLQTVLNGVVREAMALVPSAKRGSVAVVDEASKRIVSVAEAGGKSRGESRSRPGVESLVARAAQTRRSIVTGETLDESNAGRKHRSREAASFVAVPLALKDKVLAVLTLENRVRAGAFARDDVARLELFALHAALALRNAQLHASLQQEIKKIKLLRDIKSIARGGFSSEVFLRNVCDMMVEAYGYHLTAILLLDPVRRILRLAAASGSEARQIPSDYQQSINEGVVGWVARTANTRLVQDVRKDRLYINRNRLPTQAELCVPILAPSGALLGVINTESNRVNAFKETDVQIQVAVASEIAGAFEERRLLTALSNSERKFRRLFEESKDAIYVSTPAGTLIDANQAAVDLFGYEDKDEFLRVDIRKDLYEDPRDRDHLLNKLRVAGFVKDIDLRLKKKTGEPLLVNATVTVVRDNEGQIVAMQGILHDVTKQKEDERRVHESEEKYRSLVEGSLVGVYIIQNGRFAFVNQRLGEIFGYSVGEVIDNLTVEDLVHPDDRGTVMDNVRLRLTGVVRSVRYTFRGVRKDGELIEVEVLGSRSVYQGQPAVLGTLVDRTQERRQQREIDEWKRRYELIIASSAQIVYEYSIPTGIILWGGSIESVLGYAPGDLRGDIKEWEEFIHPDDREKALHELDRAIAAMMPYDVVYRYRRKDGSYAWMHDRGFVVADETGWARTMLGMMEDITQARALESKLHYSELKYRLLFEHAIDAILVLNGEVILECNPRTLEMFGSAREDVVGQTLHAFTPPHQVDGTESKVALLARIEAGLGGTQQTFTMRHIRRDGTPFEAEVKMIPFELEGERLLQVQIRDITAEAEAQEELARSEETYRRLVLEASDAILVSDGEGRLVEVNEAACTMLGYRREELLKLSVAALSHLPPEEGLVRHRKFYARLIGEDKATSTEQIMKRKDGSRFPCEVSAALLGNGLLQSILRDVSVKKQEEKELDKIYALATKFHGRELFDRAATALAEMLGIRYVSVGELHRDQIRSLVLYKAGALEHGVVHPLAGSPCERVLTTKQSCFVSHGAANSHRTDPMLSAWGIESFAGMPMMDGREEVIGVVTLMDPRPHEFSDHEKKIISVVVQRLASELDIFEQRKREEQLSQQLVQAQKMESLGTLAGGVAHDFNNILGAVIGYTTLIKKRVNTDEQTSRYLEAIEKSAQRAASLSRQLLSFSYKSQGRIERVVVNDLIRDTIHILGSSFPKNIAIRTEFAESLPPVHGDQNLLGQVVMNLCINARDAIEEHRRGDEGLITIITSRFLATSGFVDVHLSAAPGEYVSLTVRDNGAGMKPEVRERIFEPFFTTKTKGRGTGLGLSMVYGIVRNHGGFIDVQTEMNAGTEFRIFLPAATDESAAEAKEGQDIPRGNGEMLMVVEDEPMLRELLVDVLAGHGYATVAAGNGKEAVNRYNREKERIHLVILDMIMPEMDGTATFHALRALDPSLKILISSGFSQDQGVQRLLSEGAAGFIGKPYQTDELLKAVASQLGVNNA
jgi:two-component system cell cycle sensor histidine kinase/response regulator CckA